jgi:hypothetical protein
MVSVFIVLPLIHYLTLKPPKIESHLVGIAGPSHSKRLSTIQEAPSGGTCIEDTPTRDSTKNATYLTIMFNNHKGISRQNSEFSTLNIFTDRK